MFFIQAGYCLGFPQYPFSVAALRCAWRADGFGRYVLGENPVDDSLYFLRTHVLGGWIGSGVGLAGHGLLRRFGISRIVPIGGDWGSIRAGLTACGHVVLLDCLAGQQAVRRVVATSREVAKRKKPENRRK